MARAGSLRSKPRKEPVRFDSFRFRTFLKLIGSVRFGLVRKIMFSGSTRLGPPFLDASWLGPVRFGSVLRPVPAGSRISTVRFGSVRPVRFLIPSCKPSRGLLQLFGVCLPGRAKVRQADDLS